MDTGRTSGVSSLVALRRWRIRYSGLEHKMNKAIEEKVAWTPDPEITQAGDLMEHSKFDRGRRDSEQLPDNQT